VHQEISIAFKSFPMNLIAGIIHFLDVSCLFWMFPGFKSSKYGFTARFLGSHASPEISFAYTLRSNNCIGLKRQSAASSGSLFSMITVHILISMYSNHREYV